MCKACKMPLWHNVSVDNVPYACSCHCTFCFPIDAVDAVWSWKDEASAQLCIK